jgi:hypothetical protein
VQNDKTLSNWLSTLAQQGTLRFDDKEHSSVTVDKNHFDKFLEQASLDRSASASEIFEDLYIVNQSGCMLLVISWIDRQKNGRGLNVKLELPYPKGAEVVRVPSVAKYWKAARCAEIEAESLYGVCFETEWEGGALFSLGKTAKDVEFPMRKPALGPKHV